MTICSSTSASMRPEYVKPKREWTKIIALTYYRGDSMDHEGVVTFDSKEALERWLMTSPTAGWGARLDLSRTMCVRGSTNFGPAGLQGTTYPHGVPDRWVTSGR